MKGRKSKKAQQLDEIPGIGKAFAESFESIGIRTQQDLKGKSPERLYKKLSAKRGVNVDRCVLYVFRCAAYYVSHSRHDSEKLKWWNWKGKRESHGKKKKV